jgi:hypothetical protein
MRRPLPTIGGDGVSWKSLGQPYRVMLRMAQPPIMVRRALFPPGLAPTQAPPLSVGTPSTVRRHRIITIQAGDGELVRRGCRFPPSARAQASRYTTDTERRGNEGKLPGIVVPPSVPLCARLIGTFHNLIPTHPPIVSPHPQPDPSTRRYLRSPVRTVVRNPLQMGTP